MTSPASGPSSEVVPPDDGGLHDDTPSPVEVRACEPRNQHGDQPGEDQPGEDQPGEDQPGEDQPGEDQPRVSLLRAVLVELPYVLVLLAALIAAIFVTFDRWRRGVFVLGSALLLGSLFRALLPSQRAGLLQVRGRLFDSVLMASAGVAILWLATSIDSLGTDSLQ
ncbi:DUF3017 domain-containing protein [Gordonia pseudamarae]|uniref:DUF3017 domain-containing protein n=1 Tax=Gordonia pseudamarae TaxID=2831662 RepID=A0ABX6IFU7_9ACTN|nr:DUF3017 domain-containing protein [Gordonia sp. (in: high G+C Gram-positive bacteria)]QHN25776.1 DUF3017 domain-containing protein [Gordonia pseudamarae]QHN34707.1 DUF3017 domain-containing protein [Gordonia pseudamarae]